MTTNHTHSSIEKFNFHGDELDVVPGNGQAHVVVRRVCEALGVDASAQLAKLRSDPSTTVAMIPTVADDGKSREIACIEIRALPLWLATIHPRKVKPAAQQKLIDYKRECAEVLADHFLGKRGALPATVEGMGMALKPIVDHAVTEATAPLAARISEQGQEIIALRDLTGKLVGGLGELAQALAVGHALAIDTNKLARKVAARTGTIEGEEVDRLRDKVARIVEIRAAQMNLLGDRKAMQGLRADVYADLFACVEWGRKGQGLAAMPAEKGPIAKAHLDYQIRKLVKGKPKVRSGRAGIQGKLFDDKAN